jgi:Glycosyltransferase family 87
MTPKQPLSAKALSQRRVCGALIITVLSACGAHAIAQFWAGDTSDFAHFYRAASAMSKGEDIYIAAQGRYIYPPLLAFIFQPLTLLSERMAAIVWTAINGLLIFTATFIASKEAAVRWPRVGSEVNAVLPWTIAAIATCLAADKIHGLFTLGQTDCLMLLGFACVIRWMEREPLLSGLAVGASANIKYLTLICVPYFLAKRNYKAAIAAIVTFVFLLFLPALEIGFEKIGKYLASSVGGLDRLMSNTRQPVNIFQVTWDRSISLTSSIFRLTRSTGLPDLVAVILVLMLFSGVMTAIILIGRRQGVSLFQPGRTKIGRQPDPVIHIEWAVVILLAVAFSPQSTARHMVLLLPIYTVAIAIFLSQDTTTPRALLGGALALVVSALSLPFWVFGMVQQRGDWRAIGGASWCALVLILVVVWIGTRTIAEMGGKNRVPDFRH